MEYYSVMQRSVGGAIRVVRTLMSEGMGCMGKIFPVDGYVLYGFSEGDVVKAYGKDLPEYHRLLKPMGGDLYLIKSRDINYVLDRANDKGLRTVMDTDITLEYVSDTTLNISS